MNNPHEPNQLVEASLMDRLVDGELNDQQRNELLQRLEEQPAGWRQCALAFLEAQLWSRDLQQWAGQARSPANPPKSLPLQPATTQMQAFGWLAITAAMLVAFGLGQRLDRTNEVAPGQRVNQIATDDRAASLPAATEQWLTSTQVPSDVEQLLERLGAQINEERGWVLRQSPDGRPTVVPYKEVQIVPVRGPTY
jgi:anti-sigma factor RsiW